MIIDSHNLQIFGVYDRGVPNIERLVLRANGVVNLAEYFLILGFRGPMGADMVVPIPDQSLWLGNTIIETPSWIFIYTGNGKRGISQEKHTSEPIHTMYWNKSQVMLIHDDIVPALMHVDYVQIGNRPNQTLADLTKQQGNNGLAELMRLYEGTGANKPA